jgi:hypothetical protein
MSTVMPSGLSKPHLILPSRFYEIIFQILLSCLLFLGATSLADENNIPNSKGYLPSCKEHFPNLDYISALKQKLEKDIDKETMYPVNQPMYEIIWHEPGNIKAIIELDHQKEWNGIIHSWYPNGAYLGCADLENGQHKGISIAYHENGKIRAVADFVDGIPVGLEYQFNKMGQISSTKNHTENTSDRANQEKFKH